MQFYFFFIGQTSVVILIFRANFIFLKLEIREVGFLGSKVRFSNLKTDVSRVLAHCVGLMG